MLPLLIISITGSILVFKVEIDGLLRPSHMLVEADQTTQRVSLDTLMATTVTENKPLLLAGWEIFDNKSRSDAGYMIKPGTNTWYKVYINQYNGELLSEPQIMTHYITDWLLELHYTFLLEMTGAWLGFVIALITLFLGISGVILYRKFWQKLFTLRTQAAKRILFSDIHKFIGIISSPILIVIAFTGGYWNIAGILHELEEHSGDNHQYMTAAYHSPNISFETLKQQAEAEIPSFKPGYMVVPNEPEDAITFFGDVNTNNPLNSEYSSTVSFDKVTGELLSKSDIREAGFLTVFIDSFRKLHFGYFGGLTTRIIWCVIGLSPVILMITGFYLYWDRRKKKRKGNQRTALN